MNRAKRTSEYDAHRALVAAKAARSDKLARDYFHNDNGPLSRLRYHVSGAIERGAAVAIVGRDR
jgi:hypothetical protein